MKIINIVIKLGLLFVLLANITTAKSQDINNHIKDRLIIKLKPNSKNLSIDYKISSSDLSKFLKIINVVSVEKKFPNLTATLRDNKRNVDLSNIYEFTYNSEINILKIINTINKFIEVEYCEPHYLPEVLEVPNDPYNLPNQYYLTNIRAYDAWDISKSDSTVIIGITDTGIENYHEDLVDNIYYNLNDPINGIDDDNDGFIDNFRGWDLGENDNNAQYNENNIPGANPHGIHCTGLSSASTNNGAGISGVGYKSKVMPIKISNAYGSLTMSYEGIVYAAEHGCKVINCSWGGGAKSQFGQDVINYAVFNKNALVVAAAGNTGHLSNDILYPCAYDNVLCVAASNQQDLKWDHSSFGYHVDIIAPGESVYTTTAGNSYINGWGTSYASPIVAGGAALVISHNFDTLTALQVGEILRISSDNIDTIGTNVQYAEKMGMGRLNLYRALTDTLPPSVRISNIEITSSNNNSFIVGDTVFVSCTFTNYLSPSINLVADAQSINSSVSSISSQFNIGSLNTLQDTNNLQQRFKFKILSNASFDEKIILRINLSDANYSANEYINFVVNRTYLDIDTNNIRTTITGNGNIGFTNDFSFGNGFKYKASGNHLYEGGIIIGSASQNKTFSCIRGDNEYRIVSKPTKNNNSIIADLEAQTIFDDSNSPSPININIVLNNYAWVDTTNDDYIIFEYNIINNNSLQLDSIYIGIFNDWDIGDASSNTLKFSSENSLAYAFSGDITLEYVGVRVLTAGNINAYAIDNINGGAGGVDITDGFSVDEKIITLSTNKWNAGLSPAVDVVSMISYGPSTILPGDTLRVAFAYLAGENLIDIISNSENAQNMYDSVFVNSVNENKVANQDIIIYPNPANDNITISLYNKIARNVNISITDIFGNTVYEEKNIKMLTGEFKKSINIKAISNGLYFLNIKSENQTAVKKVLVVE